MKKKSRKIGWLCLVCLTLIIFQNECWAKYYDFRHTHWGMSQKEVMVAETLQLKVGGDTSLQYIDRSGILITYKFTNDRLTCIHNDVHGVHYNPHDNKQWYKEFANHCDTYRRALSERYGPGATHFVPLSQINPGTITHQWKNKQNTYSIGWKLERTNINLYISTEDFHYLRFTIVFEQIEKKHYHLHYMNYRRTK